MKNDSPQKLEDRVSRALRLDGDMRKALRDRLQSIPADQAVRAITRVEATRRRSLDLRKEAEERRKARILGQLPILGQSSKGNPALLGHAVEMSPAAHSLVGHTQDAVSQVLDETAAMFKAQGVAAEMAAPIVNSCIGMWVEERFVPRLADEISAHTRARYAPEQEIEPFDAIDGLTKIEAYCRAHAPFHAVVGINPGGYIVAQYLAARLGIDATYKILSDGSTADLRIRIPARKRVLVVDDIARTGDTVSAVWSALTRAGVEASFVTLVATVTCRTDVPFYFPLLSGRADARLPWSKTGHLTVEGDSYLFGPKAESVFSVARRQVEFIVKGLLARKIFG